MNYTYSNRQRTCKALLFQYDKLDKHLKEVNQRYYDLMKGEE